MKECTFKPRISEKSFNLQNTKVWRRNSTIKDKVKKREEQKEEIIQKECTFAPKIHESQTKRSKEDIWKTLLKGKDYKAIDQVYNYYFRHMKIVLNNNLVFIHILQMNLKKLLNKEKKKKRKMYII